MRIESEGIVKEHEQPERKVERLLNKGAELATALAPEVGANVAGTVTGYVIGGPTGAIVGAAGTPLLAAATKKAINDLAVRFLSPREELRVGSAAYFAVTKIQERLEAGDSIREDQFFEESTGERSPAEEVFEGALLACKNEHEEKKLRFIANIFANSVFMPDVSRFGAYWLLKKAEDLTYRQMCVISLIEQAKNKGVSWGPKDGDPAFEMELEQMERLIARDYSPEATQRYRETGEGHDIIGLSRSGKFCFRVMGLENIPEEDLRQLAPRFPRAFDENLRVSREKTN